MNKHITLICSKCLLEKKIENFAKRKDSPDGYRKQCRECRKGVIKQYRKNNKKKLYTYSKIYYEENKEKIDKYKKEYNTTNKEKMEKVRKKYVKNNKEKLSLRRNEYYKRNKVQHNNASKLYYKENKNKMCQINKLWYESNKERAKELHKLNYIENKTDYIARTAKRRAIKIKATLNGYDSEIKEIYTNCPEGCHIDHIIPLNNPIVCGLHVPWNLQYLTAEENLSKSNSFDGTYENEKWRERLNEVRVSEFEV